MVEKSRGLRAVPVVGAFSVPPWCGCLQAARNRSLQGWERFIPSQGAEDSSWAVPGCSHSWLVMPIYGTQALLRCQSLLPTLASTSSFFGCILVFPILLLPPLWGEVSTCGEVESRAWGASFIETQF